jgi:hypothetical protein
MKPLLKIVPELWGVSECESKLTSRLRSAGAHSASKVGNLAFKSIPPLLKLQRKSSSNVFDSMPARGL